MKTPFCLFGLLGLVCGEVFAEIDAGPMQLPEGYYVPSENPYYWILKYFIKSDTLHLFYGATVGLLIYGLFRVFSMRKKKKLEWPQIVVYLVILPLSPLIVGAAMTWNEWSVLFDNPWALSSQLRD